MIFSESTEYLYSLGNEVEAMKLGLENIETLLSALGNPQQEYLKVQVAGTNGKGSVCAFLDSICRHAGIEVGLYTSPHLISITERVKINGVDISEEKFAQLATRVRETAEGLVADGKLQFTPTFFEQMTAIALVAFAEAKVELAILETGLGGRLDAVTAARSEIAAITRIDSDHQEYLGETIEEIAAEKAAIIRSDSRAVIIGEQHPEALAVIEERLKDTGTNTTGRACVRLEIDVSGSVSLAPEVPLTSLALNGLHQIENARVAVALAQVLSEHFTITHSHTNAGLQTAIHQGRLEYIGNFLLDGAHNVGGAKALAAHLTTRVVRPITLIFAAMKDKDVREIASRLFPVAENLVLTLPKNARAMPVQEIVSATRGLVDHDRCFLTANVSEAIAKARLISDENTTIVVTGSLYLVGEVKQILHSQI